MHKSDMLGMVGSSSQVKHVKATGLIISELVE